MLESGVLGCHEKHYPARADVFLTHLVKGREQGRKFWQRELKGKGGLANSYPRPS